MTAAGTAQWKTRLRGDFSQALVYRVHRLQTSQLMPIDGETLSSVGIRPL